MQRAAINKILHVNGRVADDHTGTGGRLAPKATLAPSAFMEQMT